MWLQGVQHTRAVTQGGTPRAVRRRWRWLVVVVSVCLRVCVCACVSGGAMKRYGRGPGVKG